MTGIATRVSRTAGSLGTTKSNRRTPRVVTEEMSCAEYEAMADGLVAAQEEIGLHDGSEAGSLVYRANALESGNIAAANTQTASASTLTIAATTRLVRVTYAAGTCAIDVSALPVRTLCRIWKHNTSAYAITVVGDGNDTINDGSAGAAMTLPGSTTAMSTTTSAPSWLIYRESATSIHVMNGPSASIGRLTATAGTIGLYLLNGDLADESANALDLSVAAGSALEYGFRTGLGQYGLQTAAGRYALANAAWKGAEAACTVEAVLRVPQDTSSFKSIAEIATGGGSSTEVIWQLYVNNRKPVFKFCTSGGSQYTTTGTRSLPYMNLFHVAATMSASGGSTAVKVYVNGQLDAQATHAADPNATIVTPTMSLLSHLWNSPNGGFADGNGAAEIHGVHITNDVMSADTIAARALAVIGAGG